MIQVICPRSFCFSQNLGGLSIEEGAGNQKKGSCKRDHSSPFAAAPFYVILI